MANTDTTQGSSTVKFTLKNQAYELDISKLTGRDRMDIKRELGLERFDLTALLADEVGLYALAWLAARRSQPDLAFDAVSDLASDELVVDFSAMTETADPFGPSEKTGTAAKRSSGKSSPED